MLAAEVARAGDKELADQIMKDAESLVNPQPKNYEDYLLTWMLASGYASANPDKAFPLLQDTIARANDTLASFVKVAEFIDINGEIIEDGEVQVGAFGGSMVRGLTGELNMADSTIRILARADFYKTKDLTNRFERPEVRTAWRKRWSCAPFWATTLRRKIPTRSTIPVRPGSFPKPTPAIDDQGDAYLNTVNADQFQFSFSIFVLAMIILGGLGSIWGVVLGALALSYINFYLIPDTFRNLPHTFGLNFDLTDLGFGIFGFLLVIMMLLRPEGLLPERRRQLELTEGVGGDEALVEARA